MTSPGVPHDTSGAVDGTPRGEVRELRRDLRHWRRGRADTTLAEAIGDAYVVLFAGLVVTSMILSVLVNLRLVSDAACSAGACRDARSLLPWLTAAAALSRALAVARRVGPVFVSPAGAPGCCEGWCRRRSRWRRRCWSWCWPRPPWADSPSPPSWCWRSAPRP